MFGSASARRMNSFCSLTIVLLRNLAKHTSHISVTRKKKVLVLILEKVTVQSGNFEEVRGGIIALQSQTETLISDNIYLIR